MSLQGNGENGALLINGYANIFYVRDINSVPRTVGVYWINGGWDVDTYSIDNPNAWHVVNQIFSRNSVTV